MSSQDPARADRDIAGIALRYKRAVFAFFLRRVRNPEDAEDLTQDVFTALARRVDAGPIENIEGYVFQIAANLLRDRARRARVRPIVQCEGTADPNEMLVDELSPERQLLGRDAYREFVRALELLPERPRMIFILNRFEEMTGREIAVALGVSQRLVEKDISRVLAHLREHLS